MHKFLRRLSALCAFSLIASQSVNLVAAEGQFYIAPGIQWMDFAKQWRLDDDEGYYFGLGYDFTDQLSGEFSISDLDPTYKPSSSEWDVDLWKFDILYGLNVNIGPLQPFLVTGVGNVNLGGDNEPVWNYGGGLRYDFTDNLSLRTAIRNFHVQGQDWEDNEFGVETALVFRFGGNRAAPASIDPGTGCRAGPEGGRTCPRAGCRWRWRA